MKDIEKHSIHKLGKNHCKLWLEKHTLTKIGSGEIVARLTSRALSI